MRKILFSLVLLLVSLTNTINSQCHYLMYMNDSYGDGWNSAYLEVNMNGSFVGNFDCNQSFTLDSVYSTSGAVMEFIWHSGNYDNEISFTILEDPVIGSAHCTLTPYWSNELLKKRMNAQQVSERKGELICELKKDRVEISGKAVPYFEGYISL